MDGRRVGVREGAAERGRLTLMGLVGAMRRIEEGGGVVVLVAAVVAVLAPVGDGGGAAGTPVGAGTRLILLVGAALVIFAPVIEKVLVVGVMVGNCVGPKGYTPQ